MGVKKQLTLIAILMFIFYSAAEARIGGGRSFGSRGSRGFAPRSAPTQNSGTGSNFRNSPSQPYAPAPQPQYGQPAGGGFMRSMLGGIAGGFLGSMLFRSFGHAGMGGMEGGGFGILELLLVVGLGFLLFRMFTTRRQQYADGPVQEIGPGPYAKTEFQPTDEASVADTLRRYDAAFDLATFKNARTDDFFRIQAAWMNRDLMPIRPLMTSEMAQLLDADVQNLRQQGRINRLENIAVRQIEAVEGWQEYGKEYATLRFHANLLDYAVDEKSGAVIEGDKANPVKFEEYWTYCRDIGSNQAWLLSAIHHD